MKPYLLLFLAITSTTYGIAQTKPAAAPVSKPKTAASPPASKPKPVISTPQLATQLDSVSYAFGASIANDLKNRGINNLNYALVSKAMSDVFAGGNVVFSPEKCQEVIYGVLNVLEKKKFEGSITEAAKFLSENKQKPGIITLPSGLQFEILSAGTGAKPIVTDEVTVHYKGTLTNGQQFDSSYDRGEPTSFALNQVIPGWTEGLQQMNVGSKYRFFIPYSLAYGERGAGKDIPPYSNLIFEVELIKIGK